MKSRRYPAKPDRTTYDHTIHALVRQGQLETAYAVFSEMKQHPDTFPKDPTYEMLITAYAKRKKWDTANALERERQEAVEGKRKSEFDASFHFYDMKAMTKVGRGKYAQWEFGSYTYQGKELTIAVHPHRNPGKNGISILLVDKSGNKPVKLGYVIMINSASDNTVIWCCLLGSSVLLGGFSFIA